MKWPSGRSGGVSLMKKMKVNLRIKIIYTCIIAVFVSVFLIMQYSFNRSRNLLITQEAGIISQYMNRNELALTEVTDSIRKLSAASSTNKQVASYLNQSCDGNIYSSENVSRIRAVEETLTFYRNIFLDYRLHYIILGADSTVYSVADGIDNSSYFGEKFAQSVRQQPWYQEFLEGKEVSGWIAPCIYNDKGVFKERIESGKDEDFILFIRRIKDYNSLKFLGVSFVSFPTENLAQVLIPYDGAVLALFDKGNHLIYATEQSDILDDISAGRLSEDLQEDQDYFHYTKDGREYLVNHVTMAGTGWRMVNLVPLSHITQAVDKLHSTVTSLTVLMALGACMVCLAMYFYVNAPLNRLIHKVSEVNIGGTKIADMEDAKGRQMPVFGIVEAELEISRMVDYIEKLSAQTIKQKEIEQNLRYEMLRAQINPHFLFNTLNVIKWSSMISGAGNIADMITSLGILLESTMNRREEEVPLKEEIRVVKAWVEIKNWGLKNRIELVTDIQQELEEFKVIKFFLQPLVENAVLHGMGEATHGTIWVTAEPYGERVCVTVQDNGVGMEQGKLDEILKEMDENSKKRHVTGIGLTSIHELMKARYGPDYGLYIESRIGYGTKVFAVFPYRRGSETC